MSTQMTRRFQNALNVKRTLGVVAAAAAFAVPTLAMADTPVTMAPPVDGASVSSGGNFNGASGAPSSAASSVFSWQEIPVNQRVPIQRAVFDQGGYQLYDTVGETIVVPFANSNLYVMKFAVSPDGTTYFINDGNAPIMYLPRNAYLENASVSGARWYPFNDDFHPATPVFLGIAPSYADYCGMGWYPDMFFYGGYWGDAAFGIFTPSFGLFINIGGSPYYGWGGYEGFVGYHPNFYRTGYYHPYVYGYAGRQYWGGRSFRGYGSYAENHGGSYGGYSYNHGGFGEGNRGGFGGGGFNQSAGTGRTFYGAGRAYNTQTRSFGDGGAYGNGRNEGNVENRGFGGNGNEAAGRDFGGARGGDTETRSFGNGEAGGARTFRGAGGSYNVQNDGGRFGGGSFNGGETHSYSSSGFGHAYTGNGESAQRSFGGGGQTRSFGGGNAGGGGFHGVSGGGGGGGFHGASAGGNGGGRR